MKKSLLLVLLFSTITYAVTPVDGFWWNPQESGRGLTIETQNGVLVVAFYAYDDSQKGRWYLGSGVLNDDTGVFNGTWNAFDGGQCSGCSYTSPSINSQVSEGDFTLNFSSDTRATMTWSGGTINIERFIYGYPDYNSYLYGVWSLTFFYSSSASTASIAMTNLIESDGTEFVAGNVWGGTRPVVANVLEVDADGVPTYSMLLDSSTSFYRLYIFKANKNKITGLGWLYNKDSEPTGSGTLVLGAKFLESTESQSKLRTQTPIVNQDAIDMQIYSSTDTQGKFNLNYIPIILKMEEALEN